MVTCSMNVLYEHHLIPASASDSYPDGIKMSLNEALVSFALVCQSCVVACIFMLLLVVVSV